MRVTTRPVATLALVAALGLTAACGGGKPSGSWHSSSPSPTSNATVTISSPARDAANVPAAAEIAFKTANATSSAVRLVDAAGKAVPGSLRPDGSSWVPDQTLEYGTKYHLQVTATDDEGRTTAAEQDFTTMGQPDQTVRVTSFLGDNQVVGVAMPLIVKFSREIPSAERANVQRRLFVKSDPPQEGIWRWVSSTEVRYRPKAYWQPGTKISYRLATGGLPMGDGYYGREDVTVAASVGPSVILTVDNRTKKMTVTRNGKLLRTIPVSLGKAKTPSSSGTMVIIEKLRKTVFDTFAELGPTEGYRTDIEYAQRLTWGGEYIHAAPWSENVQGQTNVSHGCVNVSMANAKWLYGITMMGDPVIVKGTERKLQNGNGWTEWNMTWSEYVKGSALPEGS
jgi:lipoprotein-anchoring transpeptidase ErfK/SrfK